MAPVTLCTTPKHAVQLATETEIRKFLELGSLGFCDT